MTDNNPLSAELRFFEEQLPELLRHHPGKFALIKGQELVATYDTMRAAYEAGFARFGNVPMLIRRVLEKQPVQFIPSLLHGVTVADPYRA